MSGHCSQGSWCRFRHGPEGGEEGGRIFDVHCKIDLNLALAVVRERGALADHKADDSRAKDKLASLTSLEISKYQGEPANLYFRLFTI